MPHEQIEDSYHDGEEAAWRERCEEFDSHLCRSSEIDNLRAEVEQLGNRHKEMRAAGVASARRESDLKESRDRAEAELQKLREENQALRTRAEAAEDSFLAHDVALTTEHGLRVEAGELAAQWEQTATSLLERVEATERERELRPMSSAPRDGTEILAYHKDGKNFHPVVWKTWMTSGYWGMRWNQEYHCGDGFYSGWMPYPIKERP